KPPTARVEQRPALAIAPDERQAEDVAVEGHGPVHVGDPVEGQVELLHDVDRVRALHPPECSHSTTAIGSPASTTDPPRACTALTVPPAVAVTCVSIFMASRLATGSPAPT